MHYVAFLLFYLLLLARGILDKNILITVLPTIILIFYIWRNTLFKRGSVYLGSIKNPKDFGIYAFFIGVLVLSMVRTGFPNATAMGVTNDVVLLLFVNFSFYLVSKSFFRKYSYSLASNKSILVTILSPTFVILFLVLTYILLYDSLPNVEGSFRSEPLFLSLFGLNLSTKEIVFKEGMGRIHPNTFGIYSGALFVSVVLALKFIKVRQNTKIILWITMVALLLALFITDSRVTILNAFFTPLLIILLTKVKKLRLLPYLTFLIPIFPLLSLFILKNIADWEFISALSKNTHDIATGSERATIWGYCFEKLADVRAIHLVGYGEYGHYLSGASLLYDKVFNPDQDFSLMVTHNVFFQVFFDTGYIGVIIYIAMLFTLIKCAIYLYQHNQNHGLVLLGFMIYYVFSGVFESAFGTYNRIYTYLFMTVSVIILVLKEELIEASYSSAQKCTESEKSILLN